jgi:hypothetical protein
MKYLKWGLFILGMGLYLFNIAFISNNTSHSIPLTLWDFIYCVVGLLSSMIIGGSISLILFKREIN